MHNLSPREAFYDARRAIAPASARGAATAAAARAAAAGAATPVSRGAAAAAAAATAHVAAAVSPSAAAKDSATAAVSACRKGVDALTIFLYVSIAAVLITLIVLLAIPGIIIPKKRSNGCAVERREMQRENALMAQRARATPDVDMEAVAMGRGVNCVSVRRIAGGAGTHSAADGKGKADLMVGGMHCGADGWSGQAGTVAMGADGQMHAASAFMNGGGGRRAGPSAASSTPIGRPGTRVRDMVVNGPAVTQIPPSQALKQIPHSVAFGQPFAGKPYLGANPAAILQKGSYNPNAPPACGGSGVQGASGILSTTSYAVRPAHCGPSAPGMLTTTPGMQTARASAAAMSATAPAPSRKEFPSAVSLMASGFGMHPGAGVRGAAGTPRPMLIPDARKMQLAETTCARTQANAQSGIADRRAERERSVADIRRHSGMSGGHMPHHRAAPPPAARHSVHESSDEKVSADDVDSMFAQNVFPPGSIVVVATVQDYCGYCQKAKLALSKGNRKMHGGALADESRVIIVFLDGSTLRTEAHKAKYSSANGGVPFFGIHDYKGKRMGSVLGFDLNALQQECTKQLQAHGK